MNKIKLTNGSILEYKNSKWYKDGKIFTNTVLNRYKFYDPKIKGYRTLNRYGGTYVYTPYLDKLNNKKNTYNENPLFKPSLKIITLKTKGRMNLADVPVNMLDSIAINTGRSKTNIKTNLGLVGKESTFLDILKVLEILGIIMIFIQCNL